MMGIIKTMSEQYYFNYSPLSNKITGLQIEKKYDFTLCVIFALLVVVQLLAMVTDPRYVINEKFSAKWNLALTMHMTRLIVIIPLVVYFIGGVVSRVHKTTPKLA